MFIKVKPIIKFTELIQYENKTRKSTLNFLNSIDLIKIANLLSIHLT